MGLFMFVSTARCCFFPYAGGTKFWTHTCLVSQQHGSLQCCLVETTKRKKTGGWVFREEMGDGSARLTVCVCLWVRNPGNKD